MADEKLTAATRVEKLLAEVLGEEYAVVPVTRIEKFISNILGAEYDLVPTTRIEKLLAKVAEEGGGSGGGDPKQYLREAFNGTLTTYEDDEVTALRIGIPSSLTRFICHNVTTASNNSLISGSNLTALAFPKMVNWAVKNGFAGATKLTAIDLAIKALAVNALYGCAALSTLILRSTTVVNLQNVNAFSNTPFASNGSGGTLYVPQALIADYQAATNWSTILGYTNNQILPIEGSMYETQYADGTPIT